ncbi:FG-GAP-like repeat-containing protein [Streptomyces heilongjiangensis]|uniref:FG-GAP-like repeat-containing protein n=1 Tax=Streptomyces heilongjiangensis TaxID=945052 RepID=A0ABW1B757_9ACTN|nr:FG-GAP-like repeat-containing protein [Streptomyces heilongjiangensis]MDC2947438.1 FG-GAP-like repeat-containing protein [Streptomyces heilongjiangensis]
MRKNRSAALAAATFLLVSGASIVAAPSAYAGVPGSTQASDRNSDFNGDGYEDVLVGAPGATVSGRSGAGLVTVQYGSAKGIGTSGAAVFSQSTAGVAGAAEAGDGFGRAVATGDLDGDGFDDAIVGIPGEDLGTLKDAGGAAVLWGSKSGLSGAASSWLETEEPTAGERFGLGLAAARFTAETDGDLLAVLDGYDVELFAYDASKASSLRRESTQRIAARAEPRRIQPKSLTTGDYDKNGFADLVVSGLSVGDEPGYGWSAHLSGDADGLTYERDLRGGPVTASGDLNNDGYDDLVTGEPHSPDDAYGETMAGGLVGVRLGGPDGPAAEPDWWVQDSPGVPGVAEPGDGWGSDLSVADTDGDGYADVAVGASGEDIGTVQDAGAVWVLRGSASGLTSSGARSWDQNSADVPGVAEKGDKWGAQVRLTDPNRDGRFGLLAAAPGENTGDGHIWVLSAGTGGVTAPGSWTYNAASLGAPSVDAQFGAAIDE